MIREIGREIVYLRNALFMRRLRNVQKRSDWFLVGVIPVTKCNLNCPYCYARHYSEIRKEVMDQEVADLFLDFLIQRFKKLHPKGIVLRLTGGEPLLVPDIIEYILERVEGIIQDFNVTMIGSVATNGTLIDQRRVSLLRRIRPKEILVTLDGPSEIHNKRRATRSGEGTFLQVIEGLKVLVQNNLPVVLRVNVDKENVDHLDELAISLEKEISSGILERIPIDIKPIAIVNPSHPYYSKAFQTPEEFWERALPSLDIFVKHHCRIYQEKRKGGCYAMNPQSFLVAPNGDIWKCEWAGPDFSLGNLKGGKEINIEETLFSHFNPLKIKKCRTCKVFPYCLWCPWIFFKNRHVECPWTEKTFSYSQKLAQRGR